MRPPSAEPIAPATVSAPGAGLALLFRAGERPGADAIAQALESGQAAGPAARVSHRPQDGAGWLELLASGLTFDVRGLAPVAAMTRAPLPEGPHRRFGFAAGSALPAAHESIDLVPASHILAGAGLQPVVRTLLGVAANLVLHLPVAAIHWQPADTLIEPRYFARLVLGWLGGGAFPALGLTALEPASDGSIATRGLAHFTGQEMQLEGRAGESPAETAKLAIRVIDHLVRQGRLAAPHRIGTGPGALLAEPSRVGRLVLVWREA